MPLVFGYDSANHAPKGPTAGRSCPGAKLTQQLDLRNDRTMVGQRYRQYLRTLQFPGRSGIAPQVIDLHARCIGRMSRACPGTVSPRNRTSRSPASPGQRVEIPSHDDRIALGAQSFGHRAALLHAGRGVVKSMCVQAKTIVSASPSSTSASSNARASSFPVRFGKHGLFRADTGP